MGSRKHLLYNSHQHRQISSTEKRIGVLLLLLLAMIAVAIYLKGQQYARNGALDVSTLKATQSKAAAAHRRFHEGYQDTSNAQAAYSEATRTEAIPMKGSSGALTEKTAGF